MKTKPTLKSVRAELTPLGITIARAYGNEWRVRIKGSPKGFGAYCADLEEALATGKSLSKHEGDLFTKD